MLRVVVAALVLGCGAAALAQAPPPGRPTTLTGKERMSDKASDQQRVDDCGVPPERRGAVRRPTEHCRRRP